MSEKEDKNEAISLPTLEKRYPDGGWGWVVVFATGISSFINVPVMQSFALLYKDRVHELNIPTTDLATIVNINAAFGMCLGLVMGPLLKKFGYRKIALFGGFSSFIGITATSFATTFVDFLVTYSFITSMGTFVLLSSFSLAINTYFRERRGYASGMSTTLTGLGPILMPQLITFLLKHYDTTGTTMILGALSLHSVLAALLLQPVKWHMKTVDILSEENELGEEDLLNEKNENTATGEIRRRKRYNTYNSMDQDTEIDSYSLYGFETPLVVHRKFGSSQQLSRRRKSSAFSFQRSVSQNDDVADDTVSKRLNMINSDQSKSGDTVNLGSSVKIFDETKFHQLSLINFDDTNRGADASKKHEERERKIVSIIDQKNDDLSSTNSNSIRGINIEEKPNAFIVCLKSIVVFFDLDLLTDPGYFILMMGMSLAVCAELNFSLLTPLILGDYDFTIQEIATIMSTIAFADILFRFLAPFIGDKLGYDAQTLYLISLLMLMAARTSLMIFHDYISAMIIAGGLGIAKGLRTVYTTLVIPSYVPLDRLPSANGIQSMVNCVCIFLSIPITAAVVDKTGGFNWCIAVLNCITSVTVIMWTIQLIYRKVKKPTSNPSSENVV